MAILSPDDYRRAAGGRHSMSAERQKRMAGPAPTGPITAWQGYDLSDPALLEMMRGDGARTGVAGIAVGGRGALRNSTFFRAMSLISGSMGMLPTHLMRQKPDGTLEKAKDHPLFNVLHRRPNSYQTASQFKSYMQLACLLDGNAFALKIRSRGAVRELIPLARGTVTPKLSDTFGLTFDYQPKSGGRRTLQQDDLFFFRSPLSFDGITGVGLLDVAADTLGLAARAAQAAGRLMSSGVMAGGALETDGELGDTAYERLKEDLRDNYSGAGNAGDWMILEEGMKAKPFIATARDAQLAELRKMEGEEVSRFTDVPRPLLMFDETSWGSGIEQLGLFFVTYCLLKWFVIWEEAIWMCLLTPAEQETLYAKFNEGALLRGSLTDQANFMKSALGPNVGFLTQNEAREFFDRNPKEGGDDLPRVGTTASAIAQENAHAA